MADFEYRARDKYGGLAKGVISGESKEAAAKHLSEMDYTPIAINEVKHLAFEALFKNLRKVTLQELVIFTRQLLSMQKAGLPLLECLTALTEQTKNTLLKETVLLIQNDIQAGLPLSQAMAKYPRIFNEIYINMVRAGETSGQFVEVLNRLVEMVETEIDTRARINAATRYPVMAFAVLCIGFFVLVTFVIPRFAAVYAQFGAQLPLPTRIMIALNYFIKHYWYVVLFVFGAAIFAWIKFVNTAKGKLLFDGLS
jgi:type II secretory pathway component PulF